MFIPSRALLAAKINVFLSRCNRHSHMQPHIFIYSYIAHTYLQNQSRVNGRVKNQQMWNTHQRHRHRRRASGAPRILPSGAKVRRVLRALSPTGPQKQMKRKTKSEKRKTRGGKAGRREEKEKALSPQAIDEFIFGIHRNGSNNYRYE